MAAPDLDRVKNAVDAPVTSAPGPAVDVDAADLTTERWVLRDLVSSTAGPGTCGAMVCRTHGTSLFDRDRKLGPPVASDRPVFGVSRQGSGDRTICRIISSPVAHGLPWRWTAADPTAL